LREEIIEKIDEMEKKDNTIDNQQEEIQELNNNMTIAGNLIETLKKIYI
jgi:hypothetical protein